jgi:hypothetical protein
MYDTSDLRFSLQGGGSEILADHVRQLYILIENIFMFQQKNDSSDELNLLSTYRSDMNLKKEY